ncbi:MAG TPA: hypothetical protein VEF34_04835 [Syntrophobacteraceae bacterium]|nr:hypothetical protein [Syntrophobacteraceae bacterium]
MADSYPAELITGGRASDQNFPDDEKLYIRFDQMDGKKVAPDSLRCPNQSANRSTLCSKPEWVLLSEPPEPPDKYKHWGYGYVTVGSIPTPLIPVGAKSTDFIPIHDPRPYNYSHTEIKAYRSGIEVRNLQHNVRLLFKTKLAQKITPLKKPGLPVAP